MEKERSFISATGIDGSNILAFNGEAFAEKVASCAERLHKIDSILAREYLQAMGNLTIAMYDNKANFDNHHEGK